jgi:hypothetical protein
MYMNVHVYAGIFFYGLCGFNTTGTINHVQDLTTFSSIWIFFFIRTRHDDDVFYCLYTCTVNLYCCWRSNYPKKVGGLGIVDHHSLEVDVCFVDIG